MLASLGRTLNAAIPAYRIGDVADSEIITPVALEVADPVATATLRATKAREVPVVFRRFPVATNGLTVEFLNVFTRGQTNFLAAVAAGFQMPALNMEVITSEDFGKFVTAFNNRNPRFPVTYALAADWARGGDGSEVRDALLGRLRQVSAEPVRPDELPEDFVPGATVRLMPVTAANQKLSPYELPRGRLIPGAELLTVAQAQKLFCEGFPVMDQACARAVAALLKPNCYPDAAFSELVSGIAVGQLVATEHIAAGETILHRGDRVDARARAALDQLAQLPTPAPAPARPNVKTAEAPVLAKEIAARSPSATPSPAAVREGRPGPWLILVLAGISVGALLIAGWQALARRRLSPSSTALTLPAEAVTQLTQGVREAVMLELASQRRELLVAQQSAAEEITTLIRRLDDLQLPIQEREQAYEARIKALENELAARTEENRELLKLKLDSVRRQLETERSLRIGAAESGRN